jgi:hypothetical protein
LHMPHRLKFGGLLTRHQLSGPGASAVGAGKTDATTNVQ